MKHALFDKMPPRKALPILNRERKARAQGHWGPWETLDAAEAMKGARGWAAQVTEVYRNRVFSVLVRHDASGATHMAVSSLSGIRPSWYEMQRIKDDIAGETATAVEVYPPRAEVVDGADMFHIWVIPGALPFSLFNAGV